MSITHPGPVSINKNLSRAHPGPVSINQNLNIVQSPESINQNMSRTHPGPVGINQNLSKTHPGPVSINHNLCRTPPETLFFFMKNSYNRSFYVIFNSNLNNYRKIMYRCMCDIVTLLSIYIQSIFILLPYDKRCTASSWRPSIDVDTPEVQY